MGERAEGRTFEQVVADVTDATRLVGRQWAGWFEPHTAERVQEIIEEGLTEIRNGARRFGTGGIELHRDEDMGHVQIMVVIGIKWDEDAEGPEWT
jgi:hypothetical protein